MNGASAMRRLAPLGLVCAFLLVFGFLSAAAGFGMANAQPAASEKPGSLNAVDFNFVGQANLGAPFQVDSGGIAEAKGTSPAIRSYANLMVSSHIPVTDALSAILR